MKHLNFFFAILCVLLISATTYAQGGRQVGARRFILDNNDGILANQLFLIDVNGSMGIDNTGSITGSYPNTTALLSLLAGAKTTNLRIDGGSVWGIDIVNTNNSIRTSGSNIFGDGVGNDATTVNISGTGNLTLNGIAAPALPSPLSNLLYLNGSNQVQQTPGGVNIVTGSGTLNTIPLWTPTGFQLGNSILTQPNTSAMVITPTAGGTNVLTVNNFNNTSTAIKINANGGTGINVDPAGTGVSIQATATGLSIGSVTQPTTGASITANGTGLTVQNNGSSFGILGRRGVGSGLSILTFTGIWGDSPDGAGVAATSNSNVGLYANSIANSAGQFQITSGANAAAALDVSTVGTGRAAQFAITNAANTATVLNISTTGTGTGINISGAPTALSISNGNLILGSSVNTIASGGTIPNGQSVVDVNDNGVALSAATVTLPAAPTNGQVVYITTEDPDGVKISVGLASVTISNAEVGRFMFINGKWRLEH